MTKPKPNKDDINLDDQEIKPKDQESFKELEETEGGKE